jgi:predicted AAA+ superfamily ATPase
LTVSRKLSEIQDISVDQKQTLEKQDKGLKRRALPKLPAIQSHALVVSGIRRCGKSTLLRQFIQKLKRPYYYLNFDDIRLVSKTAGKRIDVIPVWKYIVQEDK